MKSRGRAVLSKARTLWRLGPANLVRAASYRLLLRTGYYRRLQPIAAPLVGPFFEAGAEAGAAPRHPLAADPAAWAALADRVLHGELPAFSHHWVMVGFPPRWQRSVLTGVDAPQPLAHWTTLPDFGLPGGDIKGYWEASRFDGLLILVLGWLCTRRDDLRQSIEAWFSSWCANNPANAGLQWKCGQETSLRLMNSLLAAELLQRWAGVTPAPAFMQWVEQHCARIAPTMLYAIAQNNNHGTSEAAALFSAGAFLVRYAPGASAQRGRRWQALGRRWLEDRIARLVGPDGSFSQQSTNYHRMMLDTCAFAETFRQAFGGAAFSPQALLRCAAATRWLTALTDAQGGDAPNLGANDGAHLFVLHRAPYRDFRPTVRWAARLFLDDTGAADDERLAWLGFVPARSGIAPGELTPTVQLWRDGGYAKLNAAPAWALLRLPRFQFRPSHADALHLDLWIDGENVLRDGGSYSYNVDKRWLHYFSGTASHNTVQFDDRDQMPRLSRFLFSDWLACETLHVDAAASVVAATYRDSAGAQHRRSVSLDLGRCRVVDEVSGFRERAVLRWRVAPSARRGDCGNGVWSDGTFRIAVQSSAPIIRFDCVDGWESRHYGEKTLLPVIEVEVGTAATLTTDITWPV